MTILFVCFFIICTITKSESINPGKKAGYRMLWDLRYATENVGMVVGRVAIAAADSVVEVAVS